MVFSFMRRWNSRGGASILGLALGTCQGPPPGYCHFTGMLVHQRVLMRKLSTKEADEYCLAILMSM
jgi:hypothetical protein